MFVVDAGAVIFLGQLVYGYINRRIYVFGRWHYREKDASSYWQSMVGMLLLAGTFFFIRFVVVPTRVFPYLVT